MALTLFSGQNISIECNFHKSFDTKKLGWYRHTDYDQPSPKFLALWFYPPACKLDFSNFFPEQKSDFEWLYTHKSFEAQKKSH